MMMPRRAQKVVTGPVIRRVLVRCSVTAKLIPTGLVIDARDFETMKITKKKLPCAHCGSLHAWTRKDVVLAR